MLWRTVTDRFSVGSLVIAALAVVSSGAVLALPTRQPTPMSMWLFARPHANAYQPLVDRWNDEHPDAAMQLYVLGIPAIERRMLSGFLADTPVADLIEPDVNVASRAFAGPIEEVGFLDLTDRLESEGLLEAINPPSFTPWTSRGRVFGIPHDVHPVLLCYRADLVEELGVDVEEIETWDDFARLLKPLMADSDGDGRPDRYLLNLWDQLDAIELLVLQAGGRYFDERDQPVIASDINAHVISTIVSWTVDGPHRLAVDAEEFTEFGNRMRLKGRVVASLMPDWLAGVWKADLGPLAGKVKLMPLPAWQPGGRRTSVMGGSMLGIARRSENVDAAWELAKRLYLSEAAAKRLFETNGIISPFTALWSLPFYDEPQPYFSGQAIGRLYINAAPEVPPRTSSPHNKLAKLSVRSALSALREYANSRGIVEPSELKTEALRLLHQANDTVERQMARNVFLQREANEAQP